MESNMGNGLETVKSEESGAEASSNSGSTTRKRYVNLRDHYPYDCERSHCSTAVRDAFLCPNSCCIQRLEQRQVNLEKELSRLDHSILLEVQHLITKVREDWGKSAACTVESLSRKLRSEKQRLALYKAKADELEEFIKIREDDERLEKEIREPEQKEWSTLRGQLDEVNRRMSAAFGQEDVDYASKRPKYTALTLARRWGILTSRPSAPPCRCRPCSDKADNAEMAKEIGRKRKYLKYNGHLDRQDEREELQKQVDAESRLGRTGSYRHHGAGAFKPVTRHLNSNKPNTAVSSSELVNKTAKKPKRPALGR